MTNKGHQSLYGPGGELKFAGEWDSKMLFKVLTKGESNDFWRHKRVLDIGSNTGGLSLELARCGAEVVAIDPKFNARLSEEYFQVLKSLIQEEGLNLTLEAAELFDAHKFGSFDAVLCLGLLYHFRYPQYLLDYLSTLHLTYLFISSQTVSGDGLILTNRRDPGVFKPGYLPDDTVLSGWHPTVPLLELMLRWAGFDNLVQLEHFKKNALKPKGLTNRTYYRAMKTFATDPEKAKRTYYPR